MPEAGERLTDEQVQEYLAARNAGRLPPKGYEDVTFENTDGQAVYRFGPTEEPREATPAAPSAKAPKAG